MFDHVVVANDEAADAGQRLRERPHHQIHVRLDAEMLGRSAAMLAEHTETVGVVDHHSRTEALGQGHQLRQRRQIALHREHPIDHDQLALGLGRVSELLLQVGHVVVAELVVAAEAQAAAVDDAGVIEGVEECDVRSVQQTREDAQVHLEAGRERKGLLAAHELGDTLFQLDVDVEGAVEQA